MPCKCTKILLLCSTARTCRRVPPLISKRSTRKTWRVVNLHHCIKIKRFILLLFGRSCCRFLCLLGPSPPTLCPMSNTNYSVMGLIRTTFQLTDFDFCAMFDAYSAVDNVVRTSFGSAFLGCCSMLDAHSSIDGIVLTSFRSALLVLNISSVSLAHTSTLGMIVAALGGASDLGSMLRTNSSANGNIVATLGITSLTGCPMRRTYALGPHQVRTSLCSTLSSNR